MAGVSSMKICVVESRLVAWKKVGHSSSWMAPRRKRWLFDAGLGADQTLHHLLVAHLHTEDADPLVPAPRRLEGNRQRQAGLAMPGRPAMMTRSDRWKPPNSLSRSASPVECR